MSEPSFDLQAFREARGLSQSDLAALIGVPRSTVMRWEAGTMAMRRGWPLEIQRCATQAGIKPKRSRRK